jgi:molybdate transport system ATP-binding protein
MLQIKIKKTLHGSSGEMQLRVNLEIKERELIAIAGKSGAGKSTLLRVLAGLEKAEGEIKIDNSVWLDKSNFLPPQKREIGFVFQDYALFNNMTVLGNLLFVQKDIDLANYLLEITELIELRDRYPITLSGGQKQRVALCRAMMKQPKLLLMDEPLSALDPAMRLKLQNEILELHHKFGTTTIIVSHDPSEIYRLASRIILLEHGEIIDDGTPKEVMVEDKNSLKGELLELDRSDSGYLATVLVGQQLIEMNIRSSRAEKLTIGDTISIL